jgi:hypothetical protein
LQAIAWAQMLRDYSRNAPISEAIARTFGGQSPCDMCTKISEERQKEGRAPAAVKFDKKVEVFFVEISGALKGPKSEDFSYLRTGQSTPIARSEAPPAPVPIFA